MVLRPRTITIFKHFPVLPPVINTVYYFVPRHPKLHTLCPLPPSSCRACFARAVEPGRNWVSVLGLLVGWQESGPCKLLKVTTSAQKSCDNLHLGSTTTQHHVKLITRDIDDDCQSAEATIKCKQTRLLFVLGRYSTNAAGKLAVAPRSSCGYVLVPWVPPR